MTKIFFFFIVILIVSCNNGGKESAAKRDDKHAADSVTRHSDFQIVDSLTDELNEHMVIEAYDLIPDTAYFFDQPNAGAQRKDYAIKGSMANMLDSARGFKLVTYPRPDGKYAVGWIKSSDLKRILFTPPKVLK
jgi:hypothetical protein